MINILNLFKDKNRSACSVNTTLCKSNSPYEGRFNLSESERRINRHVDQRREFSARITRAN